MAVLGSLVRTLGDWADRLDPDGKISTVIELLKKTNPILDDILWMESNSPDGHVTTIRTGLPTIAWRDLYEGVQPSKSKVAKVTETMGELLGYSQVDKSLADLNGNTKEFLLSETTPFVQEFNHTVSSALFYSDARTHAKQIHGLAARYPYKDANNVVDLTGSGSDVTSIWLVVWGANTVHGIFPKGQVAGLQYKDLGEVEVTDDDGGLYPAYRQRWQWKLGFCVRDWRYVVRVCNVEVAGSSDLPTNKALIEAIHKLPSDFMSMGTPVFYVSKGAHLQLDLNQITHTQMALPLKEWQGQELHHFRGIPIRTCDAILDTEDALIATP